MIAAVAFMLLLVSHISGFTPLRDVLHVRRGCFERTLSRLLGSSTGGILVIVESPAKAKTIQKYLGSDYDVDFCAGHIRDLARTTNVRDKEMKNKIVDETLKLTAAALGVDVYDDFRPLYVPMDGKAEVIKRLKEKAKKATSILLATDEDREGEAISWHLLEVLKPKVPYKVADCVF